MVRRLCLLFLIFTVSACSSVAQPSCQSPPVAGNVVYVVGREWHAEIGIPAEELDENMSFLREAFPRTRVFMFGYGKKTFFTAPHETMGEYILGPIPGPAVIQAVGLNVAPAEAYPSENTITLLLPPGGSKSLSAFIWKDMTKDSSGKPQIAAHSPNPTGLFYAAQPTYTLFHTCNTWIANALHAAKLPISGDGVIFLSQVMERVKEAAEGQCQFLR